MFTDFNAPPLQSLVQLFICSESAQQSSSMMIVHYLAFLLFWPYKYLGWYFSGKKVSTQVVKRLQLELRVTIF